MMIGRSVSPSLLEKLSFFLITDNDLVRRQAACVLEGKVVAVTSKVGDKQNERDDEQPRGRDVEDKKKSEKEQAEPLFHQQNEARPADVMKTSFPVHFDSGSLKKKKHVLLSLGI